MFQPITIAKSLCLSADSVIHTESSYSAISEALIQALDPVFRATCHDVINPYGTGLVAEQILSVIKSHELSAIKHFHDYAH